MRAKRGPDGGFRLVASAPQFPVLAESRWLAPPGSGPSGFAGEAMGAGNWRISIRRLALPIWLFLGSSSLSFAQGSPALELLVLGSGGPGHVDTGEGQCF